MCGIAGIINFNNRPVQKDSIKSMLNKIKHRGPDDEGMLIDGNIGLGHVRLSIIDLSAAGHQPMFSDDERYVIVYNGEIYNYLELRRELASSFCFRTNTDTEVLINAYRFWGEECLEHLNGMFAFVIYDKKTKQIFGARDRFGIKPFYYYKDKDTFLFASEIPPILTQLHRKQVEPNNNSIFDFLIFNRTDQTEDTFFKNIKKLQHGHLLILKENRIHIDRWYKLNEKLNNPFTDENEYRELLSSSISLRLRSDVPVGVCLSGGLDSSTIVSILLNKFQKNDLNTFSAVYGKGIIGDESRFIDEYRSQLKNMYFITPSANSFYNDSMNFVKAHAEPIPSTSPYAQYKVMQLAKDHVVVTLDGQGADEQLAGYHYFFGFYLKDLLRKLYFYRLLNESLYYFKNHKSLYGLKTFAYFLLPQKFKTSVRVAEKGYLRQDFIQSYANQNAVVGNIYNSNSLQQALIDHFEYKLEHLLKWEDRNSMIFGIESRVPFLDHRLVERTLPLPPEKIINQGMTKYILRNSMRGILPEKIRMRKDKVGFGTPQDDWFRSEQLQNYILDILNSRIFQTRNYLEANKIINLYKKHISHKINIGNEIWKWINLELWFKEFID